jgi:hypothetical protein
MTRAVRTDGTVGYDVTLNLTEVEKGMILEALLAVSPSGGGSPTHTLALALQEPFHILLETTNDYRVVQYQLTAAREVISDALDRMIT